MTAPVNDEILTFVKAVLNSKLDKEQSVMLIGDLLSNVVSNNVSTDQNWAVGMTINAYTKRVKGGVPKYETEDQDIGC